MQMNHPTRQAKSMANNNKNRDRFFKPDKVKVIITNISDDFSDLIASGTSDIVDITDSPMSIWSLQVKGIPVAATLWEVVLEGSIDGINFSTILKHTTLKGDGVLVVSGTTQFLANYFRINVVQLTLGPATSITASVVGKQ